MANLNGRVLRQNCSCRVYPYLDTMQNMILKKNILYGVSNNEQKFPFQVL